MRQDTVKIGDDRFVLAQGHDLSEVKEAMVAAIRANGGLVDLVVFGNRRVSAAVSPGVAVVFTSEFIDDDHTDDRDTGDIGYPFSSLTDYEFM